MTVTTGRWCLLSGFGLWVLMICSLAHDLKPLTYVLGVLTVLAMACAIACAEKAREEKK